MAVAKIFKEGGRPLTKKGKKVAFISRPIISEHFSEFRLKIIRIEKSSFRPKGGVIRTQRPPWLRACDCKPYVEP